MPTKVIKGNAPGRVGPPTKITALDDLALAAVNNPGEWVSVDVPKGMSDVNAYNTLIRRVLKAMGATITIRKGVIYVKTP